MKRLLLISACLPVLMAGLVGASLLAATPVAAQQPLSQFAACSGGSFFGFPSWDACLPKQDGQPVIRNLTDIWLIAFPIIETMIRAAGYLAVGLIIWGGFKYMKSQGDPGQISGARSTIQNALIGLVIAVLSVAIVRFIADRF